VKVKELIDHLAELDPNLEVLVQSEAYYDCSSLGPVEYVKLTNKSYWVCHKPVPSVALMQKDDEIL
jgi:hypothetical protein